MCLFVKVLALMAWEVWLHKSSEKPFDSYMRKFFYCYFMSKEPKSTKILKWAKINIEKNWKQFLGRQKGGNKNLVLPFHDKAMNVMERSSTYGVISSSKSIWQTTITPWLGALWRRRIFYNNGKMSKNK